MAYSEYSAVADIVQLRKRMDSLIEATRNASKAKMVQRLRKQLDDAVEHEELSIAGLRIIKMTFDDLEK